MEPSSTASWRRPTFTASPDHTQSLPQSPATMAPAPRVQLPLPLTNTHRCPKLSLKVPKRAFQEFIKESRLRKPGMEFSISPFAGESYWLPAGAGANGRRANRRKYGNRFCLGPLCGGQQHTSELHRTSNQEGRLQRKHGEFGA